MTRIDIPGSGKVLGAWVPGYILPRFDVEARKRGLSRAGLARQIIYEFLDNAKSRPAA